MNRHLLTKLLCSITTSLLLIVCGCAATNQGTESGPANIPHYSFTGSGGKSTGPLAIKSIELTFQNRQGDITLAANSQPQPQALISFNGNGLFQAQWQVDGRTLEQVSLNVVFGKTLKLHPLATTQLPTFEPGPHTVILKILSPKTTLTSPAITYFIQNQ